MLPQRKYLAILLLTNLAWAMITLYVYFRGQAITTQQASTIEQLREELRRLEQRFEAFMSLAPKYAVNLSFTPNNTIIYMGEEVTYISGQLVISGLSNVPVRPLNVTVSYGMNVELSRPDIGFYIDFTRGYTIYNITSPTLDRITCPWTAFPIKLEGVRPGDWVKITLYIYVTAESYHVPVVGQSARVYILIRVI